MTASDFLNSLRDASCIQSSINDVSKDDKKISSLVAGWNVINVIQGIGILGIPYAVLMGGWFAVVFIFIVSAMCCFTGELLADCLYETLPLTGLRQRCRKSYACIGQVVWPRFGGQMVTLISMIEMFGALVLYLILMTTISHTLVQRVYPDVVPINVWIVIISYVTLPLLFVTKLSVISWFSMTAVLCLMSTLGVIVAFCLTKANEIQLANMSNLDIGNIPTSLGIIIFSFCAHPVLACIEGSMKDPSQYPKMMRCSFTLTSFLKMFMGLMTVLIFGTETQQECTANMARSRYFSEIVSCCVFLNVFFSVPLVIYVISERMDAVLLPYFQQELYPNERCNWYWVLLTKSLILTAAVFVAMLVPHFALLMGLIGSFTGTCLCFLFPCWFHIVLKRKSLSNWSVSLRVGIIVFGLIGGCFGIVQSSKAIVKAFSI